MEREREREVKQLGHTSVGARKSDGGSRLKTQGRVDVATQV